MEAVVQIAGHLVEVMRGMNWSQAMQDYIYKPLGMTHATADPKGSYGTCARRRRLGAARASLVDTRHGALRLGKNQHGERWLSPSSVNAMQQHEIDLPTLSTSVDDQFGLSWQLNTFREQGIHDYGHNGATNGYYASLRIYPEQDVAYAILLNAIAPKGFTEVQAKTLAL